MKKILWLFVICLVQVNAQNKNSVKLGKTTKEELELAVYKKDSTANVLVLEEDANVYVDENSKYKFRTDYYNRTKFFNKKNEKEATVSVMLYKENKVTDIKAITYNLKGEKILKTFLLDDKIYTKQVNEFWKEVSFTLPNINKGCVIEYRYSLINYTTGLADWYFQSDIPKLKSEYTATIPGNWTFNTKLIGYENFSFKESYIKRNCLYVEGIKNPGDCIVSTYRMEDVPAFKEEAYMLSEENFLARLGFELESFSEVNGGVRKYTKTWKDADKTLKNQFLDKQTSKEKFFKNKLPETFFLIEDSLEKAKKAYYHVQDHMYWNGNYWSAKLLKVKKSYEEKKGSVAAINLALYNSLQALDIESYMVVLSTRDNGLLAKLYPSVDEFNYVIVKAVVNGENFFLDATDKFLPFGEVPLRCLNDDGRVLDFKKGSYWEPIKPRFNTTERAQINLVFNEGGNLEGSLKTFKTGYFGLKEKKLISGKSKDDYLDSFEEKHPNIEVVSVNTEGLDDNDAAIKNTYEIEVELNENSNTISINPFVYDRLTINPFKLKERKYPVDFGYKRTDSQLINIKIPEGYKVKSLPKKVGFSLPAKGGRYVLNVYEKEGEISLFMKHGIHKKIYSNEEYYYLKEFYNRIIKSQEQLIVLEKE